MPRRKRELPTFSPDELLQQLSEVVVPELAEPGCEDLDRDTTLEHLMSSTELKPIQQVAARDARAFLRAFKFNQQVGFTGPDHIYESICELPGFKLTAMICEPALKVYIHSLLRCLWNKHQWEVEDDNWEQAEKRIIAELLRITKEMWTLPIEVDALFLYEWAGMHEEFNNWQDELQGLFDPPPFDDEE